MTHAYVENEIVIMRLHFNLKVYIIISIKSSIQHAKSMKMKRLLPFTLSLSHIWENAYQFELCLE